MRVCAPDLAKPKSCFAQRRRHWAQGMLALLSLSGCTLFAPRDLVGPADEIMFAAQPEACGLAALAGLQGQHFTALADHQLMGQLRVIWPGQEVMSGLVPDRLNAQVSNEGRINRLSCG